MNHYGNVVEMQGAPSLDGKNFERVGFADETTFEMKGPPFDFDIPKEINFTAKIKRVRSWHLCETAFARKLPNWIRYKFRRFLIHPVVRHNLLRFRNYCVLYHSDPTKPISKVWMDEFLKEFEGLRKHLRGRRWRSLIIG